MDIYDSQFRSILEWLSVKDIEDLSKKVDGEVDSEKNEDRKKKRKSSESNRPTNDEEASSSMESGVEKKEGEPQAHFSVYPFWGGYYGKNVFHKFNPSNGKWSTRNMELSKPEKAETDPLSTRILSGSVRGGNLQSLPIPDDWVPDFENIDIDVQKAKVSFSRNKDGLWLLKVDADGDWLDSRWNSSYRVVLLEK